ncbi:MAG: hypothetical protein HY343_02165 [Lentisphaerae bacterium]|nr:hypothetical protein [Lentisphaerota bacterium]
MNAYKDFTARLKLLVSKQPNPITTTLSNIFTMRLIGNKTHGDLAEIAIPEFVNQYMYDFKSEHVGKKLYRSKSKEEDITIINELTKTEFPVSLKAYGAGPIQLSTDKENRMFPALEKHKTPIEGKCIGEVWNNPVFSNFKTINVLALIYNEKIMKCNILVFNNERAQAAVTTINSVVKGSGRKHPIYRFFDGDGGKVCEVRYGGSAANALQRGFWSDTKSSFKYFDSITDGWIDYSHNRILVQLFSHALITSADGHQSALEKIKEDIARLKEISGITK